MIFVLASLSLGACGYHRLAGLGWLEAYLDLNGDELSAGDPSR
jgi:hypothetical protein